jgi:GTP-binding protein
VSFAGLPIEFVGSFPDPLQPLDPQLPEIAFVGRSNVGKSSLLNALVGRKALARISSAPGKTELLNVYRFSAGYLLDLPGYGFAQRSKAVRAGFRELLEAVAGKRPTLTGVVWLLDARHSPSQDDLAIQDLLVEAGRPVLAVLTKADKLSAAERGRVLKQRSRELGMGTGELLLTSSTTKLGIEELRESVLQAVRSER